MLTFSIEYIGRLRFSVSSNVLEINSILFFSFLKWIISKVRIIINWIDKVINGINL